MMRIIVGIVVGYALWSALWLAGNAAFFGQAAEAIGQGRPYTEPGPLAGVIALSVACSLLSGIAAALVAARRARVTVLVMAACLLVTGIVVQSGIWDRMPVWYHLTFLALIVPVALAGGRLAGRGARPATT